MALKQILITGARGMLGRELSSYLVAKGYDVAGVGSSEMNLLQTEDDIRRVVEEYEPELIIHSAAMTNVDEAERNPDLAMAINKDGTRKLANIARDLNIIFAYISTDYVFDGEKDDLYTTSDKPNPINHYGWSKYYGELISTELLDMVYVIRTSWLYGIHGKNFVQFVLDSARQGLPVKALTDQFGIPTWTGSLCNQIEKIVTSGAYGIYHGVDAGPSSRYEQALAVCAAAGLSADCLQPVTSEQFNFVARRPRYTAMDSGPISVPHWQTSMNAYLEQYRNQYLSQTAKS